MGRNAVIEMFKLGQRCEMNLFVNEYIRGINDSKAQVYFNNELMTEGQAFDIAHAEHVKFVEEYRKNKDKDM
jgi:bifunctional ADP-heptose synthase (sugar kinase/adenylyltransferase)